MLFCFVNGPSHFEPMVPVARAAQDAGHTVAVACGPWRVEAVNAAGFEAFPIGPSTPYEPPARLPLLEVDVAREEKTMREVFADRAARRRATGVRALATAWVPQVIVADEADFGSTIAAEAIGVPHATVLVLASGSLIRADVVAATLDEVRREHVWHPTPPSPRPAAIWCSAHSRPFFEIRHSRCRAPRTYSERSTSDRQSGLPQPGLNSGPGRRGCISRWERSSTWNPVICSVGW